jgi:hypothetical protein
MYIDKISKGSITPKEWTKITQQLLTLSSQVTAAKKAPARAKDPQPTNGKY